MENEKITNLKIAIVHDFLTELGGAERVLEVFSELFPDAPIYTLLYEREKMKGKFASSKIETSFLQNFPRFLRERKKWLLPFMPTAPETFDLRDYDLVISSSGAWAKGIVTRLNTIHIAYLHSPMRFVWDANNQYLSDQKKGKSLSFIARLILSYLRIWDRSAADRPDYLIANSVYTKERIKKYYGREAEVIYPPVELPEGNDSQAIKNLPQNYFLVVARLSPYKKIAAVIDAMNKMELPLVIVGEGQQEQYLRSIAGKTITFLGWQEDRNLRAIYQNAKGFIFAGVDDFGISPVEAMLLGVPVLAIRKGGVREIVLEHKTGEFFDSAVPEVIAAAVRKFLENYASYDKELIKNRAKEFSKERFKKEIMMFITEKLEK